VATGKYRVYKKRSIIYVCIYVNVTNSKLIMVS